MATKRWGPSQFWGVGSEFDPDWMLDKEQIELRNKLIETCRKTIRPLAVQSDKTYEFPRKSMSALAELGLLGLIVPKELGGLGQSHVCTVMIVETIARYGCPSTAMIYTMHLTAVSILLFRYHDNEEIKNLLKRLDSDVLIGTTSHSDPATGGHFWFPLTSKSQKIDDDHYRIFRFNSWTTSAGYADFYIFETPTPDIERDHSNLTAFFVLKDEIRASADNWSALGLHGNQSGPLIVDGVFHKMRMIGKPGEGQKSNEETAVCFLFLATSACWNGIALGCADLAKKHVTRKIHGDVGTKVCDYPVIQDSVGKCLIDTNSCRGFLFMLADQLDNVSNGNDWTLHKDPDFAPRSDFMIWLMQAKHSCSENVSRVTDRLLKVCGGDGYKTELGLERLLRDSKAGCLMSPSNEVIRSLIGKGALIGIHSWDMWNQVCNHQVVNHEIQKMTLKEKKDLLRRVAENVRLEEEEDSALLKEPYQDTDFDNPFNTSPPKELETYATGDGVIHEAGLSPSKWVTLTLRLRQDVTSSMTSYVFSLANSNDHTGCYCGQYVQVRLCIDGKFHDRYFSPVSPPNTYGLIEIMLKYETHGIVSQYFKSLEKGAKVDFRGPCGGFEYDSNCVDHITILAAGSGVTPGLQLVRSVAQNPVDKTNITLLYYSENYEEIILRDELKEIAERDDRFRFIHTLGEIPEDWPGEEGYIDLEKIDQYVIKPNNIKHKILICGGPTMSLSCLHALRRLDFPSEMIFIYGQFGTEQIRAVYGRNVKLSSHRCDNVG